MEETIFAKWDKAIRGAEASFVNFISAIAPWGAPLPVAYMSFNHMNTVLNFPLAISIPTSLVIEILGFSTVSTIIGFWSHNRKYTDDKRKSPIGIAIGAFVLYLLIVITMNVALDATVGTSAEHGMIIAVKGLLTLMTIPAALILAVRSQHQEALMDAEETKRERAFKKYYGDDWFEMMYGKQPVSGGSQGSQRTREPSAKAKEVFSFIEAYVTETNNHPTLEEIMEATGVVKSYASKLRSKYFEENA